MLKLNFRLCHDPITSPVVEFPTESLLKFFSILYPSIFLFVYLIKKKIRSILFPDTLLNQWLFNSLLFTTYLHANWSIEKECHDFQFWVYLNAEFWYTTFHIQVYVEMQLIQGYPHCFCILWQAPMTKMMTFRP